MLDWDKQFVVIVILSIQSFLPRQPHVKQVNTKAKAVDYCVWGRRVVRSMAAALSADALYTPPPSPPLHPDWAGGGGWKQIDAAQQHFVRKYGTFPSASSAAGRDSDNFYAPRIIPSIHQNQE